MSTTATARIINAYELIGVIQPGDTPEPVFMQRGLSRLNDMLKGWSLQSLTIPVVGREVFSLTANVGTYTIGPGGDFDTTRPPCLTGAALLLNNSSTPISVSTVTRASTVATVTTAANHGLITGQNVTIHGATPATFNGSFAITVTGLTTFTYVFPGATANATGTITALVESQASDVTEIPYPVITDDAYQAIQIKSLKSALATFCYYNKTFAGGLGTIQLWPIPNVSTSALVLYRPQQLLQFANLTQAYDLPEGAEEAIDYNLALRLCAPNGVAVPADVADLARTALGTFKRGNVKMADAAIDPAWTMERRGGYNIITGGYTSGGTR